MAGTLKRSKHFIPQDMNPCKSRQDLYTEFEFNDDVRICSHFPKKNKTVIVMSTMLHDKNITGPKEKPAVILYYNETKSGKDIMDTLLER